MAPGASDMAASAEARRAYLLLLAMPLFFSSNLVIARGVGDAIPPFTLALLRWGVAVLILLPFTWRGIVEAAPVLRGSWRRLLSSRLSRHVDLWRRLSTWRCR